MESVSRSCPSPQSSLIGKGAWK